MLSLRNNSTVVKPPNRHVFMADFQLLAKEIRPRGPWPEASLGFWTVSWSGGVPVVVLQGAPQALATANRHAFVSDEFFRINQNIADSLVIPFFVVMLQEFPQGSPQAPLSYAANPAQTLAFDRLDEPFGKGIKIWASWWYPHRLYAAGPEHLIERGLINFVVVPNQVLATVQITEPDPIHGQIPGYLLHPLGRWMFGYPGNLDAPRLDVDDEQHINRVLAQPVPYLRLEEVHGSDPVAVFGDEGLPGGLLGRQLPPIRVDVVILQDALDRVGVYALPNIANRPGNPGDAPGGLAGHGDDQRLNPGWDLWATSLVGELGRGFSGQPEPALEGPDAGYCGDLLQLAPANRLAQDPKGPAPGRGEGELGALGDLFSVVVALGAHQGIRQGQGSVLTTDDGQQQQAQGEWHGASRGVYGAAYAANPRPTSNLPTPRHVHFSRRPNGSRPLTGSILKPL